MIHLYWAYGWSEREHNEIGLRNQKQMNAVSGVQISKQQL